MFKIQTLNKISSIGLNDLPRDNYEVATDINNADITELSIINNIVINR